MERNWLFFINPFLVATEHSAIKAMTISRHHDAALYVNRLDPFIGGLYESFHLLHEALEEAYIKMNAQGGTQKGATARVTELLRELMSKKIKSWDIAIQQVYEQGSTKYICLLPKRRWPYQNGAQEDRLGAVMGMLGAIGDDAALASVKSDVETFADMLEKALSKQLGNFSGTQSCSHDLEKARVAMCVGQYANLCLLIAKNASNPTVVERYFDMPQIRKPQQSEFRGQVRAKGIKTIAKRTLNQYDEVVLDNTGEVELEFYMTAMKNGASLGLSVQVPAGEKATVFAKALGNPKDHYLVVKNAHGNLKGKYRVEV